MDRVVEMGDEGEGMHTTCLGRGAWQPWRMGEAGSFTRPWALWQARRQGLHGSAPIESAEPLPRLPAGNGATS